MSPATLPVPPSPRDVTSHPGFWALGHRFGAAPRIRGALDPKRIEVMGRTSLVMILLVLLLGCYRYVPARVGTVPPGTEVRLRLSDEGAERVAEVTGVRQTQVSGELVQWAEEVMVSLPLRASDATLDRSVRQRVTVRAGEVVGIDVQELDRTRTVVLAGGLVTVVGAALVWTAVRLLEGTSGTTPRPGEGGDQGPTVVGGLVPAWLRVFH